MCLGLGDVYKRNPIKNELGISVKLVGVGEKIDDLQPFVPADYVKALFE